MLQLLAGNNVYVLLYIMTTSEMDIMSLIYLHLYIAHAHTISACV